MKKYLTAFTVLISILSIGCARQPVIVEEEDVQPQKAVTVRSDNFDQYITESTVAIIEFFSEKCAVCASLAWAIDSMSTVFGDTIFVGANNTDKDTLYKRCSVPVVPTYVFYYKGEEKTRRSFTINDPYAFDTLVELLNSTKAGISDTGDTSTPIDITHPQKAVAVNINNFDRYISENEISLVEFYSEKCGACRSLTWAIDSMSSQYSDSIFVGANNTDEDTLYKRCSVSVVPTYVFYYNGDEKRRRSFNGSDPFVFDTLVKLLQWTKAGISDTGDTSTPIDTTPPDYTMLTYATFDSLVMRKGTTAMVFFLYSGGAPCKYMDSIVRQFAPAFKNRAVIAKVEAWDEPELTDRYTINFVPQFLFFKDSVHMENLRLTGTQPGDTLVSVLEGLIGQNEAGAP